MVDDIVLLGLALRDTQAALLAMHRREYLADFRTSLYQQRSRLLLGDSVGGSLIVTL